MNTKLIALSAATFWTLACGSDPTPSGGAGAGAAGAASLPMAGQAPVVTAGSGNAGGGASGGGAGAPSVGGAAATGGASSGGTGAGSGGTGSGGLSGAGGNGGLAGGSGGSGGTTGGSDVAKALDGVRVDDACSADSTDFTAMAVCHHVMLTSSGGSKYAKQVTIAGTAGTTYDVTLRIRGVVEPTKITGGMQVEKTPPETISYLGKTWRKVPYTIGGAASSSTTDPDYTQWRIGVASPKQDYFLNDYQQTGHYIFKLDYQVTIQMAANTTVTLDAVDRNERQIVNWEKYALDGIPGSMNYGQFIQINVISAQPH